MFEPLFQGYCDEQRLRNYGFFVIYLNESLKAIENFSLLNTDSDDYS